MNIQHIATVAGVSVDEVRSRWMTLRVAEWKADFRKFAVKPSRSDQRRRTSSSYIHEAQDFTGAS